MKNTCNTCRGFEQVPGAGDGNAGICRMVPPTVQLVMVPQQPSPKNPNGQPMLTAQGFFPPVRGNVDYCCAHQSDPRLAVGAH